MMHLGDHAADLGGRKVHLQDHRRASVQSQAAVGPVLAHQLQAPVGQRQGGRHLMPRTDGAARVGKTAHLAGSADLAYPRAADQAASSDLAAQLALRARPPERAAEAAGAEPFESALLEARGLLVAVRPLHPPRRPGVRGVRGEKVRLPIATQTLGWSASFRAQVVQSARLQVREAPNRKRGAMAWRMQLPDDAQKAVWVRDMDHTLPSEDPRDDVGRQRTFHRSDFHVHGHAVNTSQTSDAGTFCHVLLQRLVGHGQ
mmetsp:Transcript_146553/g.470159  ORF Transcript_146553/g.470159 Transcript_146553/m.470159 type:complete len:258 (+) Transcript_146553:2038-2811(+)